MMMKVDFSSRSAAGELMDGPDVPFEELRACLADLERVNELTLGYRPTLGFLDRVAQRGLPRGRPLRILDVGSGYGDTLRRIRRWCASRGITAQLTGIDINPHSARAAKEAGRDEQGIVHLTCDVFDYAGPKVDIIVSSLFAHHLNDAELTRFIEWMDETALAGWFVNDLHRHPLPYWLFRGAARLLRLHPFVQHDGPVSITRAFERHDWLRLLHEAQVDPAGVDIEWWAPFRLCIKRLREP
jgi:SAM-dependent methyltransferase